MQGGSSESYIKGKIFCLLAMCSLQSSAVLQREICSTWPIFKQIPLPALPPAFPCPKQGICIQPSQAQDVPWRQPPGREFPCLRWGSQAARLGPGALMSMQSNQHRSMLVLILCHAYLAQESPSILFPF